MNDLAIAERNGWFSLRRAGPGGDEGGGGVEVQLSTGGKGEFAENIVYVGMLKKKDRAQTL